MPRHILRTRCQPARWSFHKKWWSDRVGDLLLSSKKYWRGAKVGALVCLHRHSECRCILNGSCHAALGACWNIRQMRCSFVRSLRVARPFVFMSLRFWSSRTKVTSPHYNASVQCVICSVVVCASSRCNLWFCGSASHVL